MMNLSPEDLEATQMYAIHGERFFEMPMGRRYRRSMYPTTLAEAAQQPPTAAAAAAAMHPDMYHSNRAMPMVGAPSDILLFILYKISFDFYSIQSRRMQQQRKRKPHLLGMQATKREQRQQYQRLQQHRQRWRLELSRIR